MGLIEPIRDRIEAASRCGRDRDVYAVSEPEGNYMARTGSLKIAIFAFSEFCHIRTHEIFLWRIPPKLANNVA